MVKVTPHKASREQAPERVLAPEKVGMGGGAKDVAEQKAVFAGF